MLRALTRTAKQTPWTALRDYGSLPHSSLLRFCPTVSRKLHISSPQPLHGGQLHRATHCRMSSARLLSSGPVLSPGDMRSPFPDVDIPEITLSEFIFGCCDEYKDLTAVSDSITGRKYTYRELKKYAIRVASALHRQGYRKGDVICTFTFNLPEFPVLVLACAALGVIVSPINPAYRPAELSHALTHNGARAIFTIPQLMTVVQAAMTDPDLTQNIKAVYTFGHAEAGAQFFQELMEEDGKAFPENVDLDPVRDVLALPYSSGTTGLPKGVMLSHHNLVANLIQSRELLTLRPGECIPGVLPFFHIGGFLAVQLFTLFQGGHIVTLPHFEPDLFLRTIQDYKMRTLLTVPPMVLFLAKHPKVSDCDLSSVQQVFCGAAPLGAPLTEGCQEKLGVPVYQAYGMTEICLVTIDSTPGHPGTIGHLMPNTRAKLVNIETGEGVGVGEVGEVCVKGPQVMLGYYHNQQATDDMMDTEGWLHTGDLGYMREDGFVIIADRLKELIKYKAFQVAPAELESLLLTHPDVQDAAVIGVPDEGAGELPRAYVVLRPHSDVSATDICHFVEQNASPHKRLRGGVEFLEAIPKTPSGKILRRELKAKALQTD